MLSHTNTATKRPDHIDRPHPLSWVIEFTGYSKQSIYRLMNEGQFPQSIRLGANKVAWMESEVIAWLNSRVEQSKTQQA